MRLVTDTEGQLSDQQVKIFHQKSNSWHIVSDSLHSVGYVLATEDLDSWICTNHSLIAINFILLIFYSFILLFFQQAPCSVLTMNHTQNNIIIINGLMD